MGSLYLFIGELIYLIKSTEQQSEVDELMNH